MSTEQQLLGFVSDMQHSLENSKQTDVLILDFSKAFDKVGHQRLLKKLHYYGIRGKNLAWIGNFLHGRSQYTNDALALSGSVWIGCTSLTLEQFKPTSVASGF